MRGLAALLASVLASITLALTGCSSKPEEEPTPLIEVKLGSPSRRNLEISVSGPATIFPREQANIAARITAPIRDLRAHKGDNVKAGQVLAVLDSRDLTAQKAEAAAAENEALQTLGKTRQGTLPSDLERARGALAAAEAAYNQSQKLYEKRKQLFEEGAIPQRDLLQTQTDLATNRANYEVARKSLEILQNQSNKRDIAIAESKLDQARARLRQQDVMVQFAEIRSPFDGTLTDQLMYPGDMANPGSTIFSIADLSLVTARTQLPEADVMQVRRGQSCRFTPQDRPDESIKGIITVINRAVDPQRRTVEIWCEIRKPPAVLRSSEFGQVTITTGEEKQALVIALSAAERREGTDSAIVTVIDAEMVAHKKEVRTGRVSNDVIEIISGLSGKERLAIQGNYESPDGAKVKEVSEQAGGGKQEASSEK
jgi:multidrug efflux pump subunit AcrA (membrane-fusion protein)